MGLTIKQEAFCQAYIRLGDKSAAYREVYSANKMKSETVNNNAYKLFENNDITTRIEQLQNEIKERNKIKIDDVLGVLTDMIKFDISELYNEDGSLKSIHEIPKQHRQMISSIKVFEERFSGQVIGETKEIKTLNKLDVIEKFMKHLGGYEKDNKQKSESQVTIFQLPDNGRG